MGNITVYNTGLCEDAVHPHVCGEHSSPPVSIASFTGSSPRVWGTLVNLTKKEIVERFIPTCVGNIAVAALETVVLAVHPHVCGEHSCAAGGAAAIVGSSPRVWGTFIFFFRSRQYVRFIPTCEGNIISPPCSDTSSPVHPHVCGEHT